MLWHTCGQRTTGGRQSLPSTLLEAVSGIFLMQRPDKLAFKLLLPGGETGLWISATKINFPQVLVVRTQSLGVTWQAFCPLRQCSAKVFVYKTIDWDTIIKLLRYQLLHVRSTSFYKDLSVILFYSYYCRDK